MTDILVVGDPHAHPSYDNERFDWLSQLVLEERPDTIVVMGDLWDLPSLCRHSKPSEIEGTRVQKDLEAGYDAWRRFVEPIQRWNEAQAVLKKKQYRFDLKFLGGNHEARLDELAAQSPQLEGLVSTSELYDWVEKHGGTAYPFREIVVEHGFAFSHFLPSGTMGRPIGGQTLGRSLLMKGFQSAIVGHDHRYSHGHVTRWDGRKQHGFSAGCFVHPEYNEAWCRQTRPMWDLGLLLLKGVEDGSFRAHHWVSMEELRSCYG